MRQPLIAGNWKLHGTLQQIAELLAGMRARLSIVKAAELAICPPFIYIGYVRQLLDGVDISLGAQDCSDQHRGAYTGEVAAAMLREYDCKYVIIGHSERRHIYAESDQTTAIKFEQVKNNGLTPILCVGETLQQRNQGDTEAVIDRQLNAILKRSGIAGFERAIIAYEPVWAIGTGQTATPAQAQQVHQFIRHKLNAAHKNIAENIRILYGGSMRPGNARQLLEQSDIDGGLIGGASLKAEDFIDIAVAAN